MSRHVLDSRRRRVRVPAPSAALGLGRLDPRREQLERARALVHGVPAGAGLRLARGVVIGLMSGAATLGFGVTWLGRQDARGVLFLAGLVGLFAGWAGYRLGAATEPLELVEPLLARCRMCLACGYDLSGLEAEGDGCVVCPECGGAWRVGGARAAESEQVGV
jgi:hypothetical protein